ncbi:MAG: MerR family transcriptional regulator [Termitinemataceae bacterium]|nr:MAG: MerR family transcriptional regulator [Termitinemataceae bacterium]
MYQCTTRDLEKLLGVEGYIIRYWQKEVPMIQAQKDGTGKLHYSLRDVQLLLRIKHLTQDCKYTIEGAKEALYEELAGKNQDVKASIEAIRAELLNIYFLNHSILDEVQKIEADSKKL